MAGMLPLPTAGGEGIVCIGRSAGRPLSIVRPLTPILREAISL